MSVSRNKRRVAYVQAKEMADNEKSTFFWCFQGV